VNLTEKLTYLDKSHSNKEIDMDTEVGLLRRILQSYAHLGY